MSPAFRRYIDGFNELRRARENLADDPSSLEREEERIEARLDEAWESLTPDERQAAWLETWRASPDKYARRMRPLRDTDVWANPRRAVRTVALEAP